MGTDDTSSDDKSKDGEHDYLRVPSVMPSNGSRLAPPEYSEILRQLSESMRDDYACSWCGSPDWQLEPSVYTDTLFNISGNHHVHDKVRAWVSVSCKNCGMEIKFGLLQFGLTTSGKRRDD